MENEKTCTRCDLTLPLDRFYKGQSHCRLCEKRSKMPLHYNYYEPGWDFLKKLPMRP